MAIITTIVTAATAVFSNLGALLKVALYFFNPKERSRKRLAKWEKKLTNLEQEYNRALATRQVDRIVAIEVEMSEIRKNIKMLGV